MRFGARQAQPQAFTADERLKLRTPNGPPDDEPVVPTYRPSQRPKSQKRHGAERGEPLPIPEQTTLGAFELPGSPLDTAQSLVDNMPSSRSRLNLWPRYEQNNASAQSLPQSAVYEPTGRPAIPTRQKVQYSTQEYYDPTQQPFSVSQQTSASAVRDGALRKDASPSVHEARSDSALARKPLKSALKKRAPDNARRADVQASDQTNGNDRRSRRIDLAHLFPPSRSQNKGPASPKSQRFTPSPAVDTPDYFSQDTVQLQVRRQRQNKKVDTQRRSPIDSPTTPVNASRVKIFEPDVFDNAKTNVRRPPKGIQNWFDGFDISSDDDEVLEEQEPSQSMYKSPVVDPVSPEPNLWTSPAYDQPSPYRKGSKDVIDDKVSAIRHAKEEIQDRLRSLPERKPSIDSGTMMSYVSSEHPNRQKGTQSALTMLELGSQSVLSLSDSDGGDTEQRQSSTAERLHAGHYGHSGGSRSRRQLPETHVHGARRQRASVLSQASSNQQMRESSGTIPIRLTDSINLPELPIIPGSKRSTLLSYSDATQQALRMLTGQTGLTPMSPNAHPFAKRSPHDYQETIASGETIDSAVTDASRIMAVTEEEMILLEMMRRKRAAMAKNSFAEGYQLALKQEQEHIKKRRESAQHTAQNMIKAKEERTLMHRGIKTAESGSASSASPEMRRYSQLRKEDVDRALKLERFLASTETPSIPEFPEPPGDGQTSDSDALRPPNLELLQPSVYSSDVSKGIDSLSPLSSPPSSPALEPADIEDHHLQVRHFLASNSANSSSTVFPTPPVTRTNKSPRAEARSGKRPAARSQPVRKTDGSRPALPEKSPHRPSYLTPDQKHASVSLSDHSLSYESDVMSPLEAKTAVSVPIKKPSEEKDTNSPYYLSPNFDFAPLDFSATQLSPSPSASTSRASPLTPTADKPTVDGTYSSDNASLRANTITPDTEPTSVSATAPALTVPTSAGAGKKPMPSKSTRKAPPRLNQITANQAVDARGSVADSIASITSAGADVLAAWAELGGGTEAIVGRRRVR